MATSCSRTSVLRGFQTGRTSKFPRTWSSAKNFHVGGRRTFVATPSPCINQHGRLGVQATSVFAQAKNTLRRDGSIGSDRRLPEFSLQDKVALISGGAGGVGMQQAEALLEAGATVYALDRVSPGNLPQSYHTLQERAEKELGTALDYRQVDVRNPTELHHIVAAIADKHGRLDGLIAAAGINKESPALEHTMEDFEEMLSINVTGAFLCAQAAAKQMMRFGNGGSIALIASMSGTIANKGLICPAYNASKAAVLQLARNLAMEWGPYRIRVNTISPGYIVTPMVTVLLEQHPERAVNWPKENMLGRLSKPEEYRGAAVFLLSGASSFMTGSDLIIDGGHHSW